MFNIIDLCTKGVSNCFNGTCYLFGRVAECCCGKPKAKTVMTDGFDNSLIEIDDKTLGNRGGASGPVFVKKQISPEETVILEFINKMNSENRHVQLQAMDALQKMATLAPQDAETIKALLIQFTDFLKNLGPVEQDFFVFDAKKEVQLFVLELLPKVIKAYGTQDVSAQDVTVLDGLVRCLMETFDNTTDAGKDSVLYSLVAREKCVKSINSTILEKEVELMISILSKPEFNCRADPAKRVLCSIMGREELENLSKYESSAIAAIENYEKVAEKNNEQIENYFQSSKVRLRLGKESRDS